jgi:5-methylcytosine-specific restriction endonuclease McrA
MGLFNWYMRGSVERKEFKPAPPPVSKLSTRVLVLNATYEPVHICNVYRAVTMMFKGVAVMQEPASFVLHSVTRTLAAPSVIRLVSFVHIPYRKRQASKNNILIRDRYVCQYCGKPLKSHEVTLDHIVPRSRGGESNWENLAACCPPCNVKKGSRLPEEAGLTLLKDPRNGSSFHFIHLLRHYGHMDERWRKYLFY